MARFGKELIESMQQAAKHADAKKAERLRLSRVEVQEDLPKISAPGSDEEDRAEEA